MGTVYLGRDPDLDRNVAIKVLREPLIDDELLQRFLREARATASLRHENLVTIYEVGEHDHQPFIAMEYVDGTTLAELIKRQHQLPLGLKLSYIEQICAGLHHAHRVGIVHRDIKPANVMVDSHGVIRILDFGIARVANSGMTSDGAMIGTLNYMSPEQMVGRPVDYRSDIFSLGTVAYELLSYHQAFPGSLDDGLLQRLPQEDPVRLADVCPGLPGELELIVGRALAKRPEDRFGDLDEMRAAIRRARRDVDPNLEVETVVIPSRNKAKASTRPASSAERRGLLERRARQIAVHRDAARAALERSDLDGAAAACEDALTLDPDDPEASQLLVEIQQKKEQRDQDSKARRDRERTMRHRVADAELTLVRGDVASAARQLEAVFREEPRDPAALTLLGKVREAATAAGVVLPATLNAASEREPSAAVAESARTDSGGRRLAVFAAAAVLVLAISGGALWMMRAGGEETLPAADTPASAAGSIAASPPVAESPSVPAPVEANAPTAANDAPSQPPPPVTPAPAATSSPGVTDTLAAPLARITQLYRDGNVVAALTELDRLGPSADNRVTALARSVAQTAARSMDSALTSAASQKAAELAPGPYTSAEQARRLADAALNRNDYVQSGRQALAAAEAYRRAESDARNAAAAAANIKPATPPASVAAAPPPASPAPIPDASPAPRPEAPPAAATATPPPAAVPRPSALDGERPGILRALNRYQDAYRNKSVKALQAVYPSLPRETGQRLDRQFRSCRAYDVAFLNVQVALAADDSTAATVTTRTNYTCQPNTGQAPEPQAVQDVFVLRKVDGEWLIDSAGMMDTAQRR
jgi:eukaryotic-like serine/threonine-protein kinase